MQNNTLDNDFLSYITPDPKNPNVGLVRLTNDTIKAIAKSEGFLNIDVSSHSKFISDEERLVVKIMFNHTRTALLKRETKNDSKQLIIFFHEDGVISCENEASETVIFHCFASVDDLLAYHLNEYVDADYDEPVYPFHFLVPTDLTLYKEPHTITFSQKLKRSVLAKLTISDQNDFMRFQKESSYVNEWDNPRYVLQVHANNSSEEIGFISFVFCKSCIWAIYPYEKNYARVKVMGSAEAQNKFCDFIHSFTDSGDL